MTLFVTVAMVSCDGDDSDGPKIPKNAMDGVETIYGKLNPTGKKSFKLYLDEKDGPTKLSIPGFPDIRIYRNRYVDEVPNPVPYYGWGLTVRMFLPILTISKNTGSCAITGICIRIGMRISVCRWPIRWKSTE